MALLQRVQNRAAVVAVVGLGYVGLPTATAFAQAGFSVIGADLSTAKVDAIQAGRSPVAEIVDDAIVADLVAERRLRATTDVMAACAQADCVLLVVPTPVDADKRPDLSYVESACRAAAQSLRPGQLVVLESTTFPGTCDQILVPSLEGTSGLKAGVDFGVAYCPERYNPSDPEHTLDNIPRVVGAISPAWADVASALYGSLNNGRIHVVSDLRTAEASKVIENIQRDLNIALANELALIFERLDIDIHEVMDAAATKWNFVPYRPGPGVGGHCLPVDPYYLTWAAEQVGYTSKVILAGRGVNDSMPQHVVQAVKDGMAGSGPVAVLGLSYKARTGDPRESPSRPIIEGLLAAGMEVRPCDPWIDDADVKSLFHCDGWPLDAALNGAAAVVLVTDHPEFTAMDLVEVASNVAPGCLFMDCRGVYDPDVVRNAGLRFRGIGRGQPQE